MRVGIFGGTFDPPHIGHLILAGEARDQLRLDRVLWVITPDPPHKMGRAITPLAVRLKLVAAAICQDSQFEISRVEIDRPGPHYSADTVEILARAYPQAELFYLMGGDSLHDLPDWIRPRQFIAGLAGIGVMRRPQDFIDLPRLERILPGIVAKVHFVDAPLLEISSSSIRERAAKASHYRYFLPERVYELAEKMGLYQENEKRANTTE
ncbi:MAG: nicotinate (nicotinamide) nucleotide adenylyltransferase [Anaerolineaceae bacterium]|nr:nicotinate (nicotinamide) nucleotide adenylyltransferase [Anaerolineaceae bacterium]